MAKERLWRTSLLLTVACISVQSMPPLSHHDNSTHNEVIDVIIEIVTDLVILNSTLIQLQRHVNISMASVERQLNGTAAELLARINAVDRQQSAHLGELNDRLVASRENASTVEALLEQRVKTLEQLIINKSSERAPAAAPALRLVGGSDETSGRLEVLYQGQWGFVCSSNFNNNDAIVACRQLGYRSGSVLSSNYWLRYLSRVVVPAADLNTPIWMTDLSCTGSELYLYQCSHSGWNVTRNCSLADDVAIQCQPMTTGASMSTSVTTMTPPSQSAGATARAAEAAVAADRWLLRLSQPERKRGNLEIFYNGSWGAVCISGSHDEYDATAKLACQQLNFSTGYAHSDDWLPVDKYFLRDLRCNGSEASVADCNYSSTSLGCDDGEATLVVQCMERLEERMQGVRLIDGHDNSSGYVQLFVNGSWGFLCGNTQLSRSGWDLTDAEVLCRQLGIIRPQPRLLSNRRRTQLSTSNVNFLADAFDCNGEEPTLWDCPRVQVPAFRSRCGSAAQQAVYAHCETHH